MIHVFLDFYSTIDFKIDIDKGENYIMQLMAISPIKTVDFYLSLNQDLYPDIIERQV
jgi:hypothetical protein